MPCFFLDLGATRHIKEGDRTGGIPIIALTARAMTGEEIARAFRCLSGPRNARWSLGRLGRGGYSARSSAVSSSGVGQLTPAP